MKPYSRGKLPFDYTLRVACQFSGQFSIEGGPEKIELAGVNCEVNCLNSCLVFIARDFCSEDAAKNYFELLKRYLIELALNHKIAIMIPAAVNDLVKAPYSFMDCDYRCRELGWPEISITPFLISNLGASIYPEHDYVAIDECILLLSPQIKQTLGWLVSALSLIQGGIDSSKKIDNKLISAVENYVCAVRSTAWVSSFLMTVTTFEMLAEEGVADEESLLAVEEIKKYIKINYKKLDKSNLNTILNCLNQARKVSKTVAIKNLVKKYCAPGVAKNPLSSIYESAEDCDRKIASIYNIRSIYVHDGTPPENKKDDFYLIRAIAQETLFHILSEIIREQGIWIKVE